LRLGQGSWPVGDEENSRREQHCLEQHCLEHEEQVCLSSCDLIGISVLKRTGAATMEEASTGSDGGTVGLSPTQVAAAAGRSAGMQALRLRLDWVDLEMELEISPPPPGPQPPLATTSAPATMPGWLGVARRVRRAGSAPIEDADSSHVSSSSTVWSSVGSPDESLREVSDATLGELGQSWLDSSSPANRQGAAPRVRAGRRHARCPGVPHTPAYISTTARQPPTNEGQRDLSAVAMPATHGGIIHRHEDLTDVSDSDGYTSDDGADQELARCRPGAADLWRSPFSLHDITAPSLTDSSGSLERTNSFEEELSRYSGVNTHSSSSEVCAQNKAAEHLPEQGANRAVRLTSPILCIVHAVHAAANLVQSRASHHPPTHGRRAVPACA
jgi:hypothetical protein